MATMSINGSHISTTTTKVVESVQTVVPQKPTEPRLTRRILVRDDSGPWFLGSWFHMVLYYKKASEEDSGWFVAGWIKASLGKALAEHPVIAGRLNRDKEKGELVIVSNDSGVRISETRLIDVDLDDFVNLQDHEKEKESQLVFREDIDQVHPQFSPLLYVQVTNFKCGGYAIGFSSSILVADPLAMTSFLKQWANIHSGMVSGTEITKLPLFYFPNLKRAGNNPTPDVPNCLNDTNTPAKTRAQSLIFKVNLPGMIATQEKAVATLCLEETERVLGRELPEAFTLYVKDVSGEVVIEKLTKGGDDTKTVTPSYDIGLSRTSWDDLGVCEISLQGGHKPAGASYWFNPVDEQGGLVMVIMSPDEGISGTRIIVTVPNV